MTKIEQLVIFCNLLLAIDIMMKTELCISHMKFTRMKYALGFRTLGQLLTVHINMLEL